MAVTGLTGTSLIDAVVKTVKTAYPTIDIYDETIIQGAVRPYFFVCKIDTHQEKDMNQVFDEFDQIKVQYFDKIIDNTVSKSNLNTIGYNLMDILDEINYEIGDGKTTYPIKAKFMDYKITDDVLNVFPSYPIRVYKQTPAIAKQNTLAITETSKT